MDIPIYDEREKRASHDGDEEVLVFSEFISQLVAQEVLQHPAEKGIVAFVDSKGTATLSSSQTTVLNHIIDRYSGYECKLCRNSIPLNEVLDHEMNDGYCSYHKHQADKGFE